MRCDRAESKKASLPILAVQQGSEEMQMKFPSLVVFLGVVWTL